MPDIPDFLTNPQVLNAGLAVAGQVDNSIQLLLANLANEQRYRQAGDIITELSRGQLPIIEGLTQRLGAQYGDRLQGAQSQYQMDMGRVLADSANLRRDIPAAYSRLGEGVVGELQDRYQRNMGYLRGSGEQERRDINQAFSDRQGALNQDLTSRGLSGSTLLPTTSAAIERERSDALGGLNERIRQQRLNTDIGLSGDVVNAMGQFGTQAIGAQAGLGGADIGLQGNVAQSLYGNRTGIADALLNSGMSLGQLPLQYQSGFQNSLLNLLGSREDVAPNEGNFLALQQSLGQGSARAPSYPSADYFGPLAGSLGATGGVVAGKLIIGCIDARCRVQVEGIGWIPMHRVREGWRIMGGDRKYHRVAVVDCGRPHPSHNSFVEIRQNNHWLRCTPDHIVYLSKGDRGVVWSTMPKMSADLILDGCGSYLCNGFVVRSMLQHYGFDAEQVKMLQREAAQLKSK